VKVYAYTNSDYANPVAGFSNGQVVATLDGVNSGDTDATLSSILQIPAGSTYYFRVTGTVTLTAGSGTFSGSVTTRLGGDAAYLAAGWTDQPAIHMAQAASTTAFAPGNNFIWSPNATTTAGATDSDWTNGFNVQGLPSDGSDAVTLSK